MGTLGQSITLANSIIGVGILAMPFCFQKCGVLLATLTLLFMGLISRLCCYFLLKSALIARRRNIEFLAFHVFGSAGKMAVEVGMIGFLMGTCIAYFVVVGDLGPQIVAKMFNINNNDILRTSIMVIVSLVCVLPLGLLRNVDSLSNVSAATIGFYLCLVIKVVAEAATQLVTSDWQARVEMWKPSGLLQCVPIFSMALFCQAQLFEIFESHPMISLEKMNVVTKNAINICTSVYFTLGVFGYIAFSSQEISGNILMSLSPTMGSDVIKLGFVMSLAFSFPLIIFPCRASLYSFLYKKVHSSHHDHIINHSIPEVSFRCITVAIVAVALFVSLLLPNIELVLGLVGSTIGVLVCVVFPAACFVNVTFKDTNERVLAKGVVILGLIILILGTYANLEAAENKPDRYDDKYITQERIDKLVEDFFQKQDHADDFQMKTIVNDQPKEKHNKRKMIVLKETAGDSEVQPPNPVPPDSNEKIQATDPKDQKDEDKDLVPAPSSPDKVADTHPKDLRTKLEAKLSNGVKKSSTELVEAGSRNGETDNEKNELKEKKLIETIKQHGEEQKELIKEQREILDEIIKTKNELEQNKNEKGPEDAKKIAVESIKQIADMAIKSIGGVTDKPEILKDDKKDRLEKLTNDAVQEIAKKAVETIEALQEINEIPAVPESQLNNQGNIGNVGQNIPQNPAVQKIAEQVPVVQQQNLISQQQMPVVQQNVVGQQQVIPAQQQVPPAQQQLPAVQQQMLVAQQQIPVAQQQIPLAQQVPAVQQQLPVENQQVPVAPKQAPVAQQAPAPAVAQQLPVVQQQVSADQKQVPADQQQLPADQQQVPAAQKQVLVEQMSQVQQQYSGAEQIPEVLQQMPAVQQQMPQVPQQIPQVQQQIPAVQKQNLAAPQISAIQQQMPAVEEQMPQVQQQIPQVQQQIPAVQQQNLAAPQMPAVQHQMPQVQQQIPAVQQQMPAVQQQNLAAPQMPAVQQQMPQVQQQIPAVQQQMPAVQQQNLAAPQMPAVQQQKPQVQQQIPQVQQQIPAVQQQMPAVQQQMPQVPQQIPAVQQQMPAVQQQMPAVQQQNLPAQPFVQQEIPIAPKERKEVKRDTNQVLHSEVDQQNANVKAHSHMPEEPQSYQQGEDIQAKKVSNVPIAKPEVNLQNNDVSLQNMRRKREVMDCSKMDMRPEDRIICNSLKDMQDSYYLSPDINMGQLALPRDIQMDNSVIHHLSRSLKSYEKDQR